MSVYFGGLSSTDLPGTSPSLSTPEDHFRVLWSFRVSGQGSLFSVSNVWSIRPSPELRHDANRSEGSFEVRNLVGSRSKGREGTPEDRKAQQQTKQKGQIIRNLEVSVFPTPHYPKQGTRTRGTNPRTPRPRELEGGEG